MNNIFEHITADEKLKAETLKKAKANRTVKWKTLSVIAAALVVMISVSALFIPMGKNASDAGGKAPETNSTLYSQTIKGDGIFDDVVLNREEVLEETVIGESDKKEEGFLSATGAPHEINKAPSATGKPEDVNKVTAAPSATKPPVNKDENLAKDLTAARLDDNKNFSLWLEKLKDYNTFKQFDTFGISATKRIKVSVTDMDDKPVKNASVTLYAGNEEIFKAVTDNKGIAYLYYNWYYQLRSVAPDKITVESKGKTIEEKVSGEEITVKADFEKTYLNELDIMFMIDTTGSMTDELDYLKYQTSSMLQKLPVQLDTKISVNFYRDEGDDYVVKANPFTSSIKEVTEYFSQTSASGGGDTPEAVDSALKNAIEEHSWRKDSIKLLFLVLDAEAHDDEEVKAQLYKSISMASQLGIRIVPVMASGANEVCEVMCRQMALITGGQFVFLTDHSGIGSSHREPVTDVKYEIKPLITVLKEIINEYTC